MYDFIKFISFPSQRNDIDCYSCPNQNIPSIQRSYTFIDIASVNVFGYNGIVSFSEESNSIDVQLHITVDWSMNKVIYRKRMFCILFFTAVHCAFYLFNKL